MGLDYLLQLLFGVNGKERFSDSIISEEMEGKLGNMTYI